MLRLAHRILTRPLEKLSGNRVVPLHADEVDFYRHTARACPSVLIDNIIDYMKASPKDNWTIHDFPCIASPWPMCILEWSWASSQVGAIVVFQSEEEWRKYNGKQSEWIERARAAALASEHDPRAEIVNLLTIVPVCVINGNPILCSRFYVGVGRHGEDTGHVGITGDDGSRCLFPTLLALSFLHCKNVARTDATAEVGPDAKWLRRKKAPTIRYHILDINPMKSVLRKEGNSETEGLKKALHICRGHFATYTEDKPLFGRVVGTVWKPMHVRGSEEEGVVLKDYRVKV